MIQLLYETKKQLKENVGSELEYIETSFFGEEYKSTGTITGILHFWHAIKSSAPCPGAVWTQPVPASRVT